MRISTTMLSDGIVYNMQRSLERFLTMQTQLSSGRRINTPSDDPIGTQRDLIYRSELAKSEQYRKNIDQGLNWVQSYDSILAEMKDLVSSAKETAIAMADGLYDDSAREGAAREIESILDRLLQLANSEQEQQFLFSGFRTNVKPLAAYANGMVYAGDSGRIEFQIDTSARMNINVTAQEVFLRALSILGEQADLNVGISGSTLLSDLHGGNGVDLTPGTFSITDANLGIVSTIDVSAASDIDDVLTSINAQLAADGITSLVARIGREKNNILFETTPNGLISDATALDKLNNGNGVDLRQGKIHVSDGAGINVTVDFTGAAALGDIMNAFNSQLAAHGVVNVTMQINAAGTALEIIDGNAIPLGLSISETDVTSTTGADLGILGAVSPVLTGRNLDPLVSFRIEEMTGTTAADLGIIGSFSGNFVGADLDPRLTTSALLSDLNTGNGFNLGRIVVWQGDRNRTVDLGNPALVTIQDALDALNNSGLTITASINADGRGIQIVNNDPSRTLTIEDEDGDRTAKELGVFGSSDMMGSFVVLVNALRNDDQEGTGLLLKNLDESMQQLLNYRAVVGAKAVRLENTHARLLDLDLSFLKLLSEVEDADISRLITDLATQENNYKASLMAGANIIQPTLLEFLK
ncbi:MAG TPA: flagellar hook-associated protein FlgL [Candidatus Deferrimicrobium sp.]|nr:flagellar hook-associated protein FlgL [Candidatus Deferrimicrobium sp.]